MGLRRHQGSGGAVQRLVARSQTPPTDLTPSGGHNYVQNVPIWQDVQYTCPDPAGVGNVIGTRLFASAATIKNVTVSVGSGSGQLVITVTNGSVTCGDDDKHSVAAPGAPLTLAVSAGVQVMPGTFEVGNGATVTLTLTPGHDVLDITVAFTYSLIVVTRDPMSAASLNDPVEPERPPNGPDDKPKPKSKGVGGMP